MPRLARLTTALILLVLACVSSAHAQDKGSISGRVTDRKTGHALPFATVTVPGARRGGLTDSEGQYLIGGISAGSYRVKVQFLGYRPDSSGLVTVTPGRTVVVNLQLEDVVVREIKAVEVTGERRLVEVKQGATVRSVSSGDIRNMAVQTVSDVLQQQAGVTTENDQIHVRGGRSDETIFVVNGVTNRDLVTGQSTAGQLNARSVEEVNVATGAYDVRYGDALSGVVEVKLRGGTDTFSGGLTTGSGTYGHRNFQLVLAGPDPVIGRAARMAGAPGKFASILDLSGELFDTRFLSDGTGMFQHVFSPWQRDRLRSSYTDSFLGHTFHYGNFFSPSEDNKWSGRYGLDWTPNSTHKLSLNFSKRIAIDQGFSRTFINATGDAGDPAFPWVWDHRVDHAPTIFEDNVQSSVEWRRTLGLTGFTTLQLSRYFFAQRQDVQGKMWWQYQEPDDRGTFAPGDPRRDDFFLDSGDDNTWQDRRSTSTTVDWNLTRRIKRHELEVGVRHEFQSVQYVTIQDPWVFDPSGLGDAHDLWKVHPMVGDMYLRDRIEYEGFVANLGVRGDWWFIGREAERALADTSDHNITAATRDDFYHDTRSFFGRRYKLHLSPRVIVAHPITENSSFFFNYGEFIQNPSYRYVYSKLTSVSSEAFPLLGNPNLNPEVSVNYEVGGKYEFLKNMAINTTFFVKDVYDYPAATDFQRSQGASLVDFFVYLNGHFARSKGIEIEWEKRRTNYWSGKLTYTFSQVKGKSSDPNAQKVVEESGGNAAETPLSETYVTWNRPHKLSLNADIRFDDQTPDRLAWARHAGLHLFVQGESGRAYTPVSLFSTQAAEPNSKNGPFQITTDIHLDRWFRMGGRRYDVSLSGLNVFSNHIINRIDPMTGRGRVWGVGSYDPNDPLLNVNDYTRVSQVEDPSNYGPGAQYRLQLDVDF